LFPPDLNHHYQRSLGSQQKFFNLLFVPSKLPAMLPAKQRRMYHMPELMPTAQLTAASQ
jgi:hypothetical protein